MVRYFVPDVGVKVNLLEFQSLSGETVAIFSEYLVAILEQNELKKKSLDFVQTTVAPASEVKTRGQNNVFF